MPNFAAGRFVEPIDPDGSVVMKHSEHFREAPRSVAGLRWTVDEGELVTTDGGRGACGLEWRGPAPVLDFCKHCATPTTNHPYGRQDACPYSRRRVRWALCGLAV